MLIVLEQAQGAGQRAQQDALLGPGLDLRPRGGGAAAPAGRPGVRRAQPPADPLRGVRPDRAARRREGGDRPVHLRAPAQGGARGPARPLRLPAGRPRRAQRDGDWVTVGGILTEAKRIRTKKGDPMMFATLDDLEASVELLAVRERARGGRRRRRGRLDRGRPRSRRPQGRDQDLRRSSRTSRRFEPTPEEVEAAEAKAAETRIPPRAASATSTPRACRPA